MSDKIAWGILGLGRIAHKFARDLTLVKGAVLQAVASSSQERADAFAKEHKANTAYGKYESLYLDPLIQVVYIASVHVDHAPQSLAALEAGKAVLCEKPMGINAQEVKAMMALAKAKKVFLMEAFWTRFNPAMLEVKRQIEQEVEVYQSEDDARGALAKVYSALAVTGQQGPDGDPDIDGSILDEGFSQYTRILHTLNEISTDHAVVGWGDPGLPNIHELSWDVNNGWTKGMYFRLGQVVSFANSFIENAAIGVVPSPISISFYR